MSDIRTKLLLGTSIGALAMIFVMAVGVDAFKTTTTMESPMLLGHATIMAVNPDGSVSYAQSDNLIMDAGSLVGVGQLFNPANVATNAVFNCMELGTGGIAADAEAGGPSTPLGALGQECSDSTACVATGSCSVTDSDIAGQGTGAQSIIVVEFGQLVQNDMNLPALCTNPACTSVEIDEVVLENLANTQISSLGLTPVGGVVGTVVTVTYTVTLS